MTPPRQEFPRVAASALLLARTDAVAVIVAAVWAFQEGFTFWVRAPFRQAGAGLGSALLVDLWCPVSYVPHLLLGHVLPIVILSVAGGLIGGRVLGIFRRR